MEKRILVLRYRFIGDTILTVPFLRNLRYSEPSAYIAWVVAPISSEVVKGIPYADELIYWDPETIHADCTGIHKTLKSKIDFIKMLREKKFDKVYILKRSLSSAIMAYLTGAKERIGFDTEGRGFLLTKKVKYRHDQHEVQNFLDVLRADGIKVKDDYLEAWLSNEEKVFAEDFFKKNNLYEKTIAIHPFSANPKRAWHIDNFIEVSNILGEKGYRTIFFGGKRERDFVDYIKNNAKFSPLLLIGETNIRETMAILSKCKALICNDSGIMHLGSALDIPVVAIFGPQSPVKFGPYSKKAKVIYKAFPCSPCKQKFFKECEPSERMTPRCVEAITIEDVLNNLQLEQ
ncbi:MAG: lipopolysaccharide heptosyltransferase II [Elusimicrobiales bacterium]|nr:lipopolysaccharide heptosyltransferase II [Elusimicrobiales bacterium]